MITYKMSLLRRQRSRRKGAAVVELAVTLPVFLTFLFYIIQYGYTMNAFVTLSNVARETARFAAVHGTEANAGGSIATYGVNMVAAQGMGASSGITVSSTYSTNASTTTPTWTAVTSTTSIPAKSAVKVQVSYNFGKRNLHFPFVWVPNNLNSSQSAFATMYVEPQQ